MPTLEETPKLVAKTTPADADLIPIFDVTEAGSARNKKVTVSSIRQISGGTPVNGTAQVETATAALGAGTIGTGGVVAVTITSALFPGDRTYLIPATAGDDVDELALNIREDLGILGDIDGKYTMSGSGATVVLTAVSKAANDATLNIAVGGAGTTATDVTSVASSANTTAGVAVTAGALGQVLVASGFLYAVSSVDGAGNPTWQKATLANL